MNTKPRISIAMTTFNGEKHLMQQLESFVAQTRQPDELVVGDDGSSDGTLEILNEFRLRAPFHVIILDRGPRRGFAENFLRTAAACTGDYVAFSDQDDVWLPEKIEVGFNTLIQDQSSMSMHTSIVTDQHLEKIGIGRQGIRSSRVFETGELNPHENGWGHQMMFCRRLLDAIPSQNRPLGPRGSLLPHDTWVYTLASSLGRVSHIDVPLCLYRQHLGNADGASLIGIGERIRHAVTVPLYRYIYRVHFCDEMHRLFSNAASVSADESDKNAFYRASELYADRRDGAEVRIKIYQSASLRDRFANFADRRRMNDHEMRTVRKVRYMASVKDLLLGVFGLGQINHNGVRS